MVYFLDSWLMGVHVHISTVNGSYLQNLDVFCFQKFHVHLRSSLSVKK
jgi:hypothetical protein